MWWQSCSRPQAIYVHVPEQSLVQPERARIPGGDGTGSGADRIKGNTHRAEVGRPDKVPEPEVVVAVDCRRSTRVPKKASSPLG
jgi:hypothetical protein